MNPMPNSSRQRAMLAALLAAAALLGCASPPKPPLPPLPTSPLPLAQAVNVATDRLVASLPGQDAGWLARPAPRSLIVRPLSDPLSSQETSVSASVASLIESRIATDHPDLRALPFRAPGVVQAQYLVSGTVGRTAVGADLASLNLALTDLRTGKSVGTVSVPVQPQGVDDTPVAAFADSPVLLRVEPAPVDRAEAQARAQLLVDARVDEGSEAYAAGRWADALAFYDAALAAPEGDTLRVRAGRYLALVKLGRDADADAAFARMIAVALDKRSLGVKFLFKPGTTDFWPDPNVSGRYGRWLEVIADRTAATQVCLAVVGHTSRTGSVEFNERLSLQRAQTIQRRLAAVVPELAGRTVASGVGWRENLVGSGTDDARDAVDRRVEFKVVACP